MRSAVSRKALGWKALGALLLLCAAVGAARAQAEQLPIIATYEIRQARIMERLASHDPRRFWTSQIVARVEDRVSRQPVHLNHPATVLLRFSVDRQGRLLSPAVAASSGNAEADSAALRILASAAPFPPIPDTISGKEQSFTLPMRFH